MISVRDEIRIVEDFFPRYCLALIFDFWSAVYIYEFLFYALGIILLVYLIY